MRNLKARMRRKQRYWPGRFDLSHLSRIRTVRQFDDAYTAPYHGFRDAADYYYRASSTRVAARITAPTLIITANDDPFIPAVQFESQDVRNNASVSILLTEHGGHCAYVAESSPDSDGYWAESRRLDRAPRHEHRAAVNGWRGGWRAAVDEGGPRWTDGGPRGRGPYTCHRACYHWPFLGFSSD